MLDFNCKMHSVLEYVRGQLPANLFA